jgi:hypothetical protein
MRNCYKCLRQHIDIPFVFNKFILTFLIFCGMVSNYDYIEKGLKAMNVLLEAVAAVDKKRKRQDSTTPSDEKRTKSPPRAPSAAPYPTSTASSREDHQQPHPAGGSSVYPPSMFSTQQLNSYCFFQQHPFFAPLQQHFMQTPISTTPPNPGLNSITPGSISPVDRRPAKTRQNGPNSKARKKNFENFLATTQIGHEFPNGPLAAGRIDDFTDLTKQDTQKAWEQLIIILSKQNLTTHYPPNTLTKNTKTNYSGKTLNWDKYFKNAAKALFHCLECVNHNRDLNFNFLAKGGYVTLNTAGIHVGVPEAEALLGGNRQDQQPPSAAHSSSSSATSALVVNHHKPLSPSTLPDASEITRITFSFNQRTTNTSVKETAPSIKDGIDQAVRLILGRLMDPRFLPNLQGHKGLPAFKLELDGHAFEYSRLALDEQGALRLINNIEQTPEASAAAAAAAMPDDREQPPLITVARKPLAAAAQAAAEIKAKAPAPPQQHNATLGSSTPPPSPNTTHTPSISLLHPTPQTPLAAPNHATPPAEEMPPQAADQANPLAPHPSQTGFSMFSV